MLQIIHHIIGRLLTVPAMLITLSATAADPYTTSSANPVLTGCLVKVDDDIKLPSKEAGVIVHLAVEEGSQVKAGDKLAQIDDSEPQMQKKAANYAWAAAVKKFEDDVEIRYSTKAAEVAKAEHELMLETNRQAEKAIPLVEVRAKKLEWERSTLAIEKAQHEKELAKFEAYTKQTEFDAAELKIQRRSIVAPFDGEVVGVIRKQEEWVNPGEPILRLVRLDTMRVEGAVEQSDFEPYELQGCEVTVDVEMAHGQKKTLPGRITMVSSLVRGDKKYLVRAEIANVQENGHWLLRHGLPATMTIHLNTGGKAAMDISRAK